MKARVSLNLPNSLKRGLEGLGSVSEEGGMRDRVLFAKSDSDRMSRIKKGYPRTSILEKAERPIFRK
ncbi:MAG: hypothetical protein LW715_04935 [Rhodobacter sp.]|nr:hypothetical protein [Rhodobacter sp.]